MNLIDWLCILVITSKFCFGQNYTLTSIVLEAFDPSGLKVSIPAEPNIKLFGFHGNVNKGIEVTEPGEIAGDITVDSSKTPDKIIYVNSDIKLSVGDVINYWIYIQYGFLGYRFEGNWKVTELITSTPCDKSSTTATNRISVCKDTSVFEDNFNKNTLDENIWIVEQYFPRYPDYEFVVYKKDNDVVFVKEDGLVIKPKLIKENAELYKEVLNLTNGCTRNVDLDCVHEKYLLQNPIVSGRLVSKIGFQYGEIEIRAKLPSGDWIYPQIYLEGESSTKIWIAYARGNEHLTGKDGTDIGGSLLFAGPVLSPQEPQRSLNLVSTRMQIPLSKEFHIYKLTWDLEKMQFFIDNQNIGEVKTETIKNSPLYGKNVKLVLGVGVGGLNDFPDDFQSGNYKKPWRNKNRLQVKTFYESNNEWYEKTWGEDSQLQIDYVKIRSI